MEGQTDVAFRYHELLDASYIKSVCVCQTLGLLNLKRRVEVTFFFIIKYNILYYYVLLLILKNSDLGILLPLKIFILIINMCDTLLLKH